MLATEKKTNIIIILGPLSCVPPLVSLCGVFPVLVSCDYELILVQLCLYHYL